MIVPAFFATFIGLALGLLGGGGSVLAVPMLIYVAGLPDKAAIATSLVVVSGTSVVAASSHALKKNVHWRGALLFAPAAMIGAYTGGRLARYLPGSLLIGLFSAMMVLTAWAMWRGRAQEGAPQSTSQNSIWVIATLGLVVGLVTGLVGAGGGFLVVPALALVVGMPMRIAIGTSLVVIAANSASALVGYVSHVSIDLWLAAVVTMTASLGAIVGSKLATRISTQILRRSFAVLVLIMGITLLARALRASAV